MAKTIKEEPVETDKTLGFFEKRKIKKLVKFSKKHLKLVKEASDKLSKDIDGMTDKQVEEMDKLFELMVDAIVGTTDKKGKRIPGLIEIFEVKDDKTGEKISKEMLMDTDVEDVMQLFSDLLEDLEDNI